MIGIVAMAKGALALGAKVLATAKVFAPEISIGAGIAGMIGTAVLASVETTKAEEILNEAEKAKENADKVQQGIEAGDEAIIAAANEKGFNYDHECKVIRGHMIKSFAKLYAPSIVLGLCSIALILYGHHLMVGKIASLGAAVAGLTESYNTFRSRVAGVIGEDATYKLERGIMDNVVATVNENGETVMVENDKPAMIRTSSPGAKDIKPYTFDFSLSPLYDYSDKRQNLVTLKALLSDLDLKYKVDGSITENDILRKLKLPLVKEGFVMGNKQPSHDDPGIGDPFVDFGLDRMTPDDIKKYIFGEDDHLFITLNIGGNLFQNGKFPTMMKPIEQAAAFA